MKIEKSPRRALLISIILIVIGLIIFFTVESIQTVDITKLSAQDKIRYELGNYEEETPIWKIVCYVIVGILFMLSWIVDFVMCRCRNCGKHIHSMDVFMRYCPYCSKDLQ